MGGNMQIEERENHHVRVCEPSEEGAEPEPRQLDLGTFGERAVLLPADHCKQTREHQQQQQQLKGEECSLDPIVRFGLNSEPGEDGSETMGAPKLPEKKEKGLPVLYHSTRFFVLCLSTACLTFCIANPLILNFTVICMDDVIPDHLRAPDDLNGTSAAAASATEQHWLQNMKMRNLLFSASAIGTLIGSLPITFIIQRFGTKTLFMIYGVTSAISTALFPLAVWTDVYAVIFAVRIFQGFGMAFTMSGAGAVCESWSPIKEFSTYISVLSTQWQLSPIFTMPVSAAFCMTSVGWRGVFYLQAAITAVIYGIFFVFFKDDPAMHRKVSAKELSIISMDKEPQPKGRSVPYAAICTNPCMIGAVFCSLGCNFGFYMLLSFGPIYLNQVLHFEIASTGIATALPYILAAILKFFAGPLSERTTCLSERGKIIFFASVSQGFMAFCFLVLALTSQPTFSQICFTAASVFSGLNVIGVTRCIQLVARQYMPFVLAVCGGLTCFINLVLPSLVAAVASENTPEQWAKLFYGCVAVIFVSNAVFVVVAKAEAAPWTKANYKKPSEILDKQDTISSVA